MNIQHIAHNEDGFVLVAAMMIMVVLTLLGISATSTSVIERQIAVNEVLYKDAFYQADGGTEAGIELVEQNLSCPNGFTAPFSVIRISGIDIYEKDFAVNNQGFKDVSGADAATPLSEIPSDSIRSARICIDPSNRTDSKPHTNLAIWGGSELLSGSAIAMVAGYEGKGKGSATGGGVKNMTIFSTHTGGRNSRSDLALVWRHVIGQEGTCRY